MAPPAVAPLATPGGASPGLCFVDGGFGDDTFAVVRAFQRSHGLQGLGMVGPKTWRLLNVVR